MAVARSPVRKNLVTTFRASPKTCRLTPISMLQTRSLPCNQGRDRDGNGTRPPTTFGCPIPTTGSEAAGGSGVFEQAAQNRGTRTNETGLHCQSRLHSPPTGGLNCQKVAGCGDARRGYFHYEVWPAPTQGTVTLFQTPEERSCLRPAAAPGVGGHTSGLLGVEFKRSNYFVGSAVAAAVGSAPTTLNFTSRQLPLSFGSHTFMSRFSIFAWNVPGSNMSFGLSGTSS